MVRRPRVITYNLASVDGRLTLAPGVNLMALLREGLVDEIDIELLPWAIGGRGTPALFDAPPLAPDEWPTRLELLDHEALPAGRIRLRYSVGSTAAIGGCPHPETGA